MNDYETTRIRNFMLYILCGVLILVGVGCSIQCAYKNRDTDCGFTNDNIQPSGRKDPMIFYGDSVK